MQQTPRYIITIIVGTLSLTTLLYVGTLAYCVVFGATAAAEVMREFSTVGMFLSGVLSGMLTKTSGSPEPVRASQTTVTNTETTDDTTDK